MKILIVGGTGFIGSHVVRQLAAMGHEPIVFHRGNSGMDLPCEHLLGDWRDMEKMRVRADVAVNMILSSGIQAGEFMSAMRGKVGRVVVASSMDVYRACGIFHGSEDGLLQETPLNENSDLRTKLQTYPKEMLDQLRATLQWIDEEYDKISVERAIQARSWTLPATILRLPMVYGPRDYLRRFYPVLKRIDDGRKFILFDEGHANWKSPRGYVENVAAAIAQAAVNDRVGLTYNVSEQPAFSELEWARKIAKAANWDGEFVVMPTHTTPAHLIPRGNTAQQWEASSALLREALGYREVVSIDEGIRRTIEWDRANAPTGPLPYAFDYAAEDAAVNSYRKIHMEAPPASR